MSRAAFGQSPAQTAPGPSRPASIPLFGTPLPPDAVRTNQQTTDSSDSGATLAVSGSVTIMRPFNGSAPSGIASNDVLKLTMQEALDMGLRLNLGVVTEASAVLQSRGQRKVARSELLPNLTTAISEELERLNLRTVGVETNAFPETVKFNFFDARAVRLQQTLFDVVKIDNLHSASETLKASLEQAQNARDLVVLAVGGSYLQLLATKTRISAAEAQVETARAIYQQATDRHSLGLAARIDVTRSQVQLQTEEQRLRSLQAGLETQSLRFARIVGLPLGQRFIAIDDFSYTAFDDMTVESALQIAMRQRADLEAATSSVKAAEAAVKAAQAERLPNITVNGDFGAAGITPSHESAGVYVVSGTITFPLYTGGRIGGDVQQATAALHQRNAELQDLTGQVDQDIRQAFIDLRLAADQARLATSNSELARETLTQSRDRFSVGVTDTVEVVQAEQAVVQADDDYISAVFEHNLAKISLARALGNAEQSLSRLIRK
ncbi:MAG TPA: TolC family protein [Candidatus Acidoferrales bacterium]|nr:TolC family protein [Candidatus Acidoferrales bacterium]